MLAPGIRFDFPNFSLIKKTPQQTPFVPLTSLWETNPSPSLPSFQIFLILRLTFASLWIHAQSLLLLRCFCLRQAGMRQPHISFSSCTFGFGVSVLESAEACRGTGTFCSLWPFGTTGPGNKTRFFQEDKTLFTTEVFK